MSVEITTLPSGLRIVTHAMREIETVSLGVWLGAGARNESEHENGISHLLEHMAFKGTARRSARAISEEIEAVGGSLNAYTSREQTAFHARVLKNDVGLALDLLADILINPAFAPDEIAREKQVVLQELGQARDTPDDIIFDHLQAAIYAGQPLGWSILGEEDTVSNFSRPLLQGYMASQYRAGSMTLVASGAVRHDELVSLAEKLFAGLAPGAVTPPAPARYVGGDVRFGEDLEQAHITFAFPGLSNADPDYYVGQLYTAALGGGMSSRLFQEARERRGLCYSIYAFTGGFQDSGFLSVYAGTGEAEAGELAAVVAGEMEAMAGNFSEAELGRARAQLKASLLMGLERAGGRAEQIAGQLFALGRIQSPAEIVAHLDAIDLAAVKSYAARVMGQGAPTIAALGPVSRLESHDRFARRFGSGALPHAAE